MHIFTTARNPWLLEGLRQTFLSDSSIPEVQVTPLATAGALLTLTGNRLPEDAVLLPAFPDNDPVLCLRSFAFLHEWKCLQSGLFRYRALCLLWGESPVIRLTGQLPVIPWRCPPQDLRARINYSVQAWHRRRGRRAAAIFQPGIKLSPRELTVLQHTLDGRNLEWIAREMGLSGKTVWTHRRRAMDTLGIRRLHDLMQISSGVLNQVATPVRARRTCHERV